jgi:hypothetical protein
MWWRPTAKLMARMNGTIGIDYQFSGPGTLIHTAFRPFRGLRFSVRRNVAASGQTLKNDDCFTDIVPKVSDGKRMIQINGACP